MSTGTGENEQGLMKILDFTRLAAIVVLLLHFYYYCYKAFEEWQLTTTISSRLLQNIYSTGLFGNFNFSKLIALGLLVISLIGAKGRKDEKLNSKSVVTWLLIGLFLFFLSSPLLWIDAPVKTVAVVYMAVSGAGFLLVLSSGTMLSRLIKVRLSKDIFNELNESFPHEERFIENEFSLNLPAQYKLKQRVRKSWINIINPFRGLLVIGSPGAGKSWFIIQHVIKQHIEKGFAMFVYDFKYDDLSRIAYNWLQLHSHKYDAFFLYHQF